MAIKWGGNLKIKNSLLFRITSLHIHWKVNQYQLDNAHIFHQCHQSCAALTLKVVIPSSYTVYSLTHRVNNLFKSKLCSVLCSSQHKEEWSSRGVTAVPTTCVRWPSVLCSHCSAGQTSVYQGILHIRTHTLRHANKITFSESLINYFI